MEKHVATLSHEQRLLGHEVTIMFNQGQETSVDDIQLMPATNLRGRHPQFVRDFSFYVAVFIRLLRAKRKYDLVHVHGDWSAFLFSFFFAKTLFRPTMVASIHGGIKRGKLWRFIYSFVLKKFDVVYATGSNEAKLLGEYTGKVVRWRSSGISDCFYSSSLLDFPETSVDVISVSNFYPVKNQRLAVEVASLLPQYKFLLVGDGPERQLLQNECSKRGIQNIKFTGALPQAHVAQRLSQAKVFLITSFSEGTPTAMIEAMASGLTIVSSKSNNYELLFENGFNGYVVDSFTPEDFADRIATIVPDVGLRKDIRRINMAIAKEYSWASVAREITGWCLGSR